MTIAPTLQKYMDEHGIRYDLVLHEPTLSTLGSAHAGHISGNQLAKGVVLRDGEATGSLFSRPRIIFG